MRIFCRSPYKLKKFSQWQWKFLSFVSIEVMAVWYICMSFHSLVIFYSIFNSFFLLFPNGKMSGLCLRCQWKYQSFFLRKNQRPACSQDYKKICLNTAQCSSGLFAFMGNNSIFCYTQSPVGNFISISKLFAKLKSY